MRILAVCLAGCCLGCHGPLTVPMVERLDKEQQKEVDDSWSNMLSPPTRLSRTVLLDTMLANQFHQRGVDSLRLVSEKQVNGGRVVLEINFEKNAPNFDEFVFTCLDTQGNEIRRERYTRDDVEQRVRVLMDCVQIPEDEEKLAAMDPAQLADLRRRAAEQRAAHEAIRAATQPSNEP